MDKIKEIKELIELMNENELAEIEVEDEGGKIKLKKAGANPPQTFQPPMAGQQPPLAQYPAGAPSAEAAPAPNLQTIKSPMVGTFYSAPAQDAEPYVKVGSAVEVGQVVCIVEAMKLMNEIKSEIRGTVAELHVQNGDPIEFGQVLFSVR